MPPLAFVSTVGSAQVSETQRRLIRSHCMRQKNKQPGSRRSTREARRLAAGAAGNRREASSTVVIEKVETPSESRSMTQQRPDAEGGQVTELVLPPHPPSDLAFSGLPSGFDKTSYMHFHRYFFLNPVRDTIVPFSSVGIKLPVVSNLLWRSPSFWNDHLHFLVGQVVVSASNDFMTGHALSDYTRRKLQAALPLLNQRLAKPNAHWHPTTLQLIGILAAMAVLFRDYRSAAVHARGISQILRLRHASKPDYRDDLTLQISLDRFNFSGGILADQWTSIRAGESQQVPDFPEEVELLHEALDMVHSDIVPDRRLATVFHVLQCAAILFNSHDCVASCIAGPRLHEALSFAQTQLLWLRGQLSDKLSECLRLGMMAFLATTFRVPGHFEHPCCSAMAQPLLEAYEQSLVEVVELPQAVQTWLWLVGTMTASGLHDERARTAWRSFSVLPKGVTWQAIRLDARRVMWIDAFHDAFGRNAYDILTA